MASPRPAPSARLLRALSARTVGSNTLGEEVGRDAGAVVDDADEGIVGVFAAGDLDRASWRRVTQRVVDDVGERAFEAVAVDPHRVASVSCHLELDSTLVGRELERGSRVGDGVREVCRLQPGSLVEIRPRVVEQARDEPIDLLGLRPRSLEPLTGVADARCDRVEVAAQREQRRAQVMGDGADEQASLGLESRVLLGCLREPGAHACDRLRRRSRLPGSATSAGVSIGSPPAIASTCVFRRRSGTTSQRLAAHISSVPPTSRAASPAASATSSRCERSSGEA